MDNLLSLILTVLTDVLPVERKTQNTRRMTTAAICIAFALFALAGALGCAIAALWIYLASAYGAFDAALGSTAALLVTSGVLIMIVRGQFRNETGPAVRTSPRDEFSSELYRMFVRHKGSALLAALVAGLTAGSNASRGGNASRPRGK